MAKKKGGKRTIDPLEVILYLHKHTERGGKSAAARHFGCSPAYISQILRDYENKQIAVSNEPVRMDGHSVPSEATVIREAERDTEEQMWKIIRRMEGIAGRINRIYQQALEEGASRSELRAALMDLQRVFRDQANTLAQLKGLVGNVMIDARSITIERLPAVEREHLQREALVKAAEYIYQRLSPEAQQEVQAIVGVVIE